MTAYEMLPQRDLVKRKRQAERRVEIVAVLIALAIIALVTYVMGLRQ